MVATGAVTARQAASGVERLRTPLAVSGLGAGRINAFANRLAGHERFIPFAAGAAAAPPAPGDPAEIVPGGNFAAAISYGEITAAGVGTTTLVCDGTAVAFGHPFNFDGPTALSAHTADAILIQDDPLGAPFKLANIGGTVGTLDQDRLSGIRAVFGDAPDPVLVQSRVNDPAARRTTSTRRASTGPRRCRTSRRSTWSRTSTARSTASAAARSTVGWTVTGTAGGKQFSLTRNNKFADRFDISFFTPDELFSCSPTIAQNPFVDVTFDEVKIDANVQFPFREYRITGVEQRVGSDWEPIEDSITATPGSTLRVRALLAQDRSTTPIAPVEFSLKVPATASGEGSLDIMGGSGGGGGGEEGMVTESGEPETFDELLDLLRKTPQNNQVVASLSFFGGGEGGEGGSRRPCRRSRQTKDAAEVVTGGTSISVSIPGEEPSCGEIEPCEPPGGSGPTLNLGGKSAFKLAPTLKKGLKLTLRTSEAGRATVKALVDRKTARRLKIKKNAKGPVVVAAMRPSASTRAATPSSSPSPRRRASGCGTPSA